MLRAVCSVIYFFQKFCEIDASFPYFIAMENEAQGS
jgi:hypothetical protein